MGDYKNTSVGRDFFLTRAFETGTRVVMNATGGDTRATRDNFKCVYWSDGFVTGGSACPPKGSVDAYFYEWLPLAEQLLGSSK